MKYIKCNSVWWDALNQEYKISSEIMINIDIMQSVQRQEKSRYNNFIYYIIIHPHDISYPIRVVSKALDAMFSEAEE